MKTIKNNNSLFIFDLDRTLIKSNSSFRYFSYLRAQKVFSPYSALCSLFLFFRYQIFRLSLEELHREVFRYFLQGIDYLSLTSSVSSFLDGFLMEDLYAPVVNRLKEGQKMGGTTLLLSSSPEFLIKPIATRLNMDGYLGTQYEIDEKNRVKQVSHLVLGQQKADFTQAMMNKLEIEKKDVTAFSDSLEDLPLLEMAGRAVVVRPCRKLRNVAKGRNWEILE